VYVAGRSKAKAETAIAKLKEETGKTDVHFLQLDLADIPSAVAAAKELASNEQRLDLLFNNGGVMKTPDGAKTPQGYELQWGTNVVGHFVFTKELLPLLLATAKDFPDSTRVLWTSSNGHSMAPKGIINFDDVNLPNDSGWTRYGQSKAAVILLATAMTHKYSDDGLLTFAMNPGGIKTEITRSSGAIAEWFLVRPYPMPTLEFANVSAAHGSHYSAVCGDKR